MAIKNFIPSFILVTILFGCTKEYYCDDLPLQPAFIGFAPPDIDSFVLRKFKPHNNYQNLLDTFIVTYGASSPYQTSNDTTTVFVSDASNSGQLGIKAGYDWEIFIPAINRTVFISDIESEKGTGKRSWGIFNLDKNGNCTNRIFSAKVDGHVFDFTGYPGYFLFIHK